MKKVLTIFCVLCALALFSPCIHAENVTPQSYCRVEVSVFKNDRIWVDLGRDNKEEAQKLEKYTSIVDVLNELGNNGWKVIDIFQSEKGAQKTDVYILEKVIK